MKVKISPFFIALGIVLWAFCGGALAACCLISITLHELAHIYAAKALGIETSAICVGFYGCRADMDNEINRGVSAELPVALAGPALNLVLALLLALLSQVLYFWYYPIMDMAMCNLALGAFNLLPFTPLDGGRILKSIICVFTTRAKAAKLCTGFSLAFAFCLGLGFLYFAYYGQYKVFLLVLSAVIAVSSLAELKAAAAYDLDALLYEKPLDKPRRIRHYAVCHNKDMREAIKYFKGDCFNVISVVSKDGRIEKTVTETELKKAINGG